MLKPERPITCIIISTCTSIFKLVYSLYPPRTKFRGVYRNHVVCPSVCANRVRSITFECHYPEIFHVRATWDFLEAGHGKGPCDGLEASVKRSADMNIKQGKGVIQTAEDFFAWTESITSSSVKYFYVSNEDVENCSQYIQSVSSQLLSVPGTMKVHAVSPVCSEFIIIRNMSCYCQGCNNNLSDRACAGWSKCRISKQSTELEINKNSRDNQLEPQVHAEIENQGNENDSSNAENRFANG